MATLRISTRELEIRRRNETMARVLALARCGAGDVVTLCSMPNGLDEAAVEERREEFGPNKILRGKKVPLYKRLFHAFIDPFTSILLLLACVSFVTDVVLPAAGDKNFMTPLIVLSMVLVSGILRFIHETRSGNAAARLSEMVKTTTLVERQWPVDEDDISEEEKEREEEAKREREERGEEEEERPRVKIERREIALEDIVPGDIVHLSAGDMIPADLRIIHAKDFFVSQAALTGESEPLEKTAAAQPDAREPLDCVNLAFMGSNVISGSAVAITLATGNDTFFGGIAKTLNTPPAQTSFQRGMNEVSWVLIRFMLVMVPVVFFLNGVTKGDWLQSFLFAITVAVGLTPEMLPMIVTTCLARGAVAMSQKKTIIKNLNSIQNFGAMNVLCTDKTGTLTQDRVVLELHLDARGNTEPRVLYHGFLNSHYQTGLKNLVDIAVMAKAREEIGGDAELRKFTALYEKVDEIPFDFERRRMSVVVANKQGARQLITKGAVEEMLSVCAFVEFDGRPEPLTKEVRSELLRMVDRHNNDGMRVIAVAKKDDPAPVGAFSVADEAGMVLIGFLALLDPPKETTAPALRALKEYGVVTKVLTGDNDLVSRCICRQVGLEVDNLLLGSDIEAMDDAALARAVESTNVFAKLSPQQKIRIVTALRNNGHVVGYMGDGINDAGAMKASDVGISVDTAVDIAKESADIILLEKDLMVLENGIIEGRKTYANMIKYIKMTASSNFGNMVPVMLAALFLPFLPMLPLHLLLLNLIYDCTCTSLPWDNVDVEFLKKPREWAATSIGSFMRWIGPTSSVFDITTYLLMFFIICPLACGGGWHLADVSWFGMKLPLPMVVGGSWNCVKDVPEMRAQFIALFHAGWFVESMWTQTLVIHTLRTPKIPILQSRASFHVIAVTLAGITILTAIPFTFLGRWLKLAPLPGVYFAWLALTVILYMSLAQFVKNRYIRRFGELL